ncbi:MAG: NAD(P)/FAD-dependent oxidoreductase [Bernardetiaceae bacterium]|nr:NAD(P)/FAD-dependent oxidoreductase [Bernardetiaceae bacterium]
MSHYDAIIIGGGLAGLTTAILLAQAGERVALVEKHQYPFHKVCGEYISNEVLPFLKRMGIEPFAHAAVDITQFKLSAPNGKTLKIDLPLGGFGISRFRLDELMYQKAQALGVTFILKNRVIEVFRECEVFTCKTTNANYTAKVIIGAHGKRDSLDRKLERPFYNQKAPYIGVKYHIKTDLHPPDEIALHNFEDGYCGISRIEDEKYCFCYLSHTDNLDKHRKIDEIEAKVLKKNPFLQQLLSDAEVLYRRPEIIHKVSFAPKAQIVNGIWMCGDAAGLITPLCGNGMAMAIRGANLLAQELLPFLNGKRSRSESEKAYTNQWKREFALRLKIGRGIQHFFGSTILSNLLVRGFAPLPTLSKRLISFTHGKPF